MIETEVTTGRVICYYTNKGYGFIDIDRGRDVQFHIQEVEDKESLTAGQSVEVTFYERNNKLKAAHVKKVVPQQCIGTGRVILFRNGGKIVPDEPEADTVEFSRHAFLSPSISHNHMRVQFLAELRPNTATWRAVWVEPEGCPEPDSPIEAVAQL